MRVILAAGTTRTAAVEGISAAGADPSVMAHTPSADAEIVAYGRPVRAPVTPVSPTGCPTPALVTRAVRDVVGFDLTVVDAGLAEPTGAPTVDVGAAPGAGLREAVAVPGVQSVFEAARSFGRALPDERVTLAETIPGGTTTALGTLRALGEDAPVASSLPENPMARKRDVVAVGFDASDAAPGDFAGEPVGAVRAMGDPVLAVLAGVAAGALDGGTDVVLGGGTQMLAVAALVRHLGYDDPLTVGTTTFLVDSVPFSPAARALDCTPRATDPRFEGDHVVEERFRAGEAKEGAGMGGALLFARRVGASMTDVRDRTLDRYETLVGEAVEA